MAINRQFAEARANTFRDADNRLSFERALTEAVLEQVIIDLDNRDLLPKKVIDNK